MHYGERRPDTLAEYHWNSTQSAGDDKIIITPKELKRVAPVTSTTTEGANLKFFIATQSQGWALFTVQAYPVQKDQLTLGFDYPESGLVLLNEIVSYSLTVYGGKQ